MNLGVFREFKYDYYGSILLVMAFLLPWNSIMRVPIACIAGLLLVLAVREYLKKDKKVNYSVVILFSSLFLAALLRWLIEPSNANGLKKLETQVLLFIFPIAIFLHGQMRQKQYFNILKIYVVSSLILITFIFSKALFNYVFIPHNWNVPSDYFFYTDLAANIDAHPTYLSLGLMVSIISSFALFENGNLTKSKLAITLSLLIFTILLLNSRIVTVVSIILMLILIVKSFKFNYRLLLVFAVTISLFSILAYYFLSYHARPNRQFSFDFSEIEETMSKRIVDSKSSGLTVRLLIWDMSFDAIKEAIWIGAGTGNAKNTLAKEYSKNNVEYLIAADLGPHNMYISILLELGVIGLIIFLIFVVVTINKAAHANNLYYVLILLPFLVVFLVETILSKFSGVVIYSFFTCYFYNQPVKRTTQLYNTSL